MARVGVWPTSWLGAVFVTPTAVGYGYYTHDQLGKLQADLERGLSPNEAAGFTGGVCPFTHLRRVYVQEHRKRVVVEYTDMLLKDRADFSFLTTNACQEFCTILVANLGPEWQRGQFPRPGWLRYVLPTILVLAAALILVVSTSLFFIGPERLDPVTQIKTREAQPFAGLLCGSVSLLVLATGLWWLWYIVKYPPRADIIQRVPPSGRG